MPKSSPGHAVKLYRSMVFEEVISRRTRLWHDDRLRRSTLVLELGRFFENSVNYTGRGRSYVF